MQESDIDRCEALDDFGDPCMREAVADCGRCRNYICSKHEAHLLDVDCDDILCVGCVVEWIVAWNENRGEKLRILRELHDKHRHLEGQQKKEMDWLLWCARVLLCYGTEESRDPYAMPEIMIGIDLR